VGCRIEAHPPDNYKDLCIIFGENVEINDYVHIAAHKRIEIGNNVLIAGKIFITDLNHGSYGKNDIHDSPEILPNDRQLSAEPVIIEDNVWIGEFVSILPGVRIGKGSIIGTMSVVSKSIPEYCIAAGSPAKIIKRYDFNLGKWIRE
jgi:lipopolysaccharide O-acetyltransferase